MSCEPQVLTATYRSDCSSWTASDLVKVTLQWGSAGADRKLYAFKSTTAGSKQEVNTSQINESVVAHNFNSVSHTEFYNILMQGKGFQVFKKLKIRNISLTAQCYPCASYSALQISA